MHKVTIVFSLFLRTVQIQPHVIHPASK